MKKSILSLFCLLSIHFASIFAQNAHSISGTVIDATSNEAIAQATIRILKKDSTYVNGHASDVHGKFSIPAKNGTYIVQVSYIGYKDWFYNVTVSSSKNNINLGTIKIHPNNILLKETVVTAKATEVTVKGDTLEYNADSYKVQQGAVVEDLFKKMPGVEVDSEGKITVNGKQVKKILIDGEEFFSNDPKVASKNLPAKMVNKIQVLDRRSDMAQMTGFDDGDEETVINLSVKPDMKEGLMGNTFAGYGSKQRYEANALINYMKHKNQYTFIGGLNNTNNAGFSDLATGMFAGGGRGFRGGMGNNNGITQAGNAGLNFSQSLSSSFKWGGNMRLGETGNDAQTTQYTQNLIKSGNTFERENAIATNKSLNFNSDFRLEWTPDTLTKIIFQPSFSIYKNQRNETGNFITTTELNDTINYGNSQYASQGNGKEMSGRLEVSRELGKKGRVLSAQLRVGMSDTENNGSSASNTYYLGSKPDDIIDQQFSIQSTTKNWRGYLSYVEPIGNNNFVQLAYSYRQNISTSDKKTFSQDANGNYTLLDSTYSKNLKNQFDNQKIELNFKSVRAKYDYTLGFSVSPSSSQSSTGIGNTHIDERKQNVINYAPTAQFNYRWNRQKNLRINYEGSTEQPSVTQLSPVRDVSNPLNVTYGNPNLKPSFSHQLRIRFMNFNSEQKSSYGLFSNINYLTKDIVPMTTTDIRTGYKETTYENVKGNWNANTRLVTNIPLKNIKYSVFSMSFVGYNHTNGFSNGEANLNQRLNLMQVAGINYRSDVLDMSLRGNVSYNSIRNSLANTQNQEYYNYSGMANTTLYLPYDFSITSDITYNTNSGYTTGYQLNEWLWNASLQKQIFKNKNGTIRFKIYDILQQRSNISRTVTANYIRDTTTNTLTSYFMFHFVYRFNIFKGGAVAGDMQQERRGFGPPRRF